MSRFATEEMIMATMANLGFPSARITLFPIIHRPKKGTPYKTMV